MQTGHIVFLPIMVSLVSSYWTMNKGDPVLEALTKHRRLDLLFPNLNGRPTITRMRKPSPRFIENNINYSGAVLCGKENITAWTCKTCLSAASQSDIDDVNYFENEEAGTAGFVSANTALKTLVLVFRGGRTLANGQQAGDVQTVHFKPLPLLVKVNRGILEAMESVSPQFLVILERLLKKPSYKNYSITVIGHSHGSSIASLAIVRLQHKLNIPWEKLNLYVYGQPRIGNSHFASWLNSKPLTSARVVNSNDVITQFPTKAFSYHVHHQNLYYVDQQRNVTGFCRQDVLEDPKCYIYPDFTAENILHHVVYFGVVLTPDLSC